MRFMGFAHSTQNRKYRQNYIYFAININYENKNIKYAKDYKVSYIYTDKVYVYKKKLKRIL